MSEKNPPGEPALAKTYDAHLVEPQIAQMWDKAQAFAAGAGARAGEDTFTIVIPPPNVTGSLHMGHALNNTLQDILVRFERMRGKDVLWQPGMDHAGIATQMVVERQLMENQQPDRHAMGREKFVEKIWQWKEESGGIIFNQLKRLGASCDWSRERFTMDEGLSEAVVEVFVKLYNEGLIYKDKRLVNWDPVFQTAISDLEVEQKEVDGHMWSFAYPLVDGPVDGITEIVISTTRPETMLGDGAVAVHPSDERYKNLIGKMVRLPIAERHIPIIEDEYPDPEFGTGAVKITGAHDFNDFEVARRNNIPLIPLMDGEAKMIVTPENNVPKHYEGLDRFVARKLVLEEIEELGFYRGVEDKVIAQPFGDRSGVVIEPMLTDQWYVNAQEMAKPAIASVREGRTKFVPKTWENTYFNWMENIQPWCISRQLWWGHQIPAWYGPDGRIFVGKTENEVLGAAEQHYGKVTVLTRDPDVLDTWFSSALWPFSTLGWPEKTPELAKYYPTSVLSTAFDIIFFWVARMMMMSLHFMKDEDGKGIEPFHSVYIHPLVRDKSGAKMSKSKGNGIDPLEVIDEYGADALRFTLAILAVQGRDVKLDPARIAGYRNFGTKLWNATRFAEMNGVKFEENFKPQDAKLTINRWILAELSRATADITANIEKFRFNDAAGDAYKFVWNSFCDWYLELLKPVFSGDDEAARIEAQACAAYVLAEIYKLLHPFMPFMTEELWQRTAQRQTLLCHASWPQATERDDAAANEINWLIKLVSDIRSVRAEMGIKPGLMMAMFIIDADEQLQKRIETHRAAIGRLARVESIELAITAPKGSAQIVIDDATYCLPLEGIVDFSEERSRLENELKNLDQEISRLDKKLSNERFVANAPDEVVKNERAKLAQYQSQKDKISAAFARIENISGK
ncbi:MAG: valine--tRNA ligase [Rhizobiaceae bacterium]|nr:valine--tRNA ligase [Rhizobiaceae bacterium]